ncbi:MULTISPECIES: hypothetical protein [unclassified Neglectibacter]|uniref:hypothetical protein n=1 Tax=unclassified Neglectibacter TaxID=2632164 RepID=UPI0014132064|nr:MULTISPECIES: hypothetical protein [unclassified Neglectibacter]
MKKILTTILTAALLVSSAGCQMKQPQATHSEPEPALQALVLNVDLPSDISGERIDTSAVIEQITAGLKVKLDTAEREKEAAQVAKEDPKTAPAAQQKEAKESEEQQKNPAIKPKTAASTPTPEPPATEPDAYLKVTVKATPTPPPAATPAPAPAPTPEPPAATPEPVQSTPEPVIEESSFDIGYWIGYAQSCAQGLGLRLESSAVDCWDNPLGAGPRSTCLERDISSRLNRYANDPDITDVWVWYESIGGNNYNIYIGYA